MGEGPILMLNSSNLNIATHLSGQSSPPTWRLQLKIMLLAAIFGILASLADAIMDAFFFYEGTLIELTFTNVPPHEVYIRTFIFTLTIAFGFITSIIITRVHRAEHALQQSNQRLELAIKGAQLGLWDWDIQSGEVHFSPQWAKILGYEPEDLKTTYDASIELVHPHDLPALTQKLQRHLDGETPFYEAEHRLRHQDGTWRWVLDTGKVVERDANSQPLRAAGTLRDITSRKEIEEELRLMASTDMLTGVANRREGLMFLEKNMHMADRNNTSIGLCFLDLNKFKEINDTFGHDEGDRVLRLISSIVGKSIRKSDFLMRFGGDEFVVIMPGGNNTHAVGVWQRILNNIHETEQTLKLPYTITMSHGFAEYQPGCGKSMTDLITEADREMYRNKKS